jgi:FlaA1/EpsC-like NDP-sugar epimerase
LTMKSLRIYPNLVVIHVLDIVILTVSILGAYALRFDFQIPAYFFDKAVKIMPFIIAIKLVAFHYFDLYRGMWRFTGIMDLLNIIRAATISTLVIVLTLLMTTHFQGYPRSAFLIDWCLTIFLVGGLRLGVRFFFERYKAEDGDQSFVKVFRQILQRKSPGNRNLLIIGAGNSGETLFREIKNNPKLKYKVVGFVDDHRNKLGKKIHGIPVLGTVDDLDRIASEVAADEILIAVPSATASQIRRMVTACKDTGLSFKTLPGYGELIDGRVTVNAIREVTFKDLLGRESVDLDQALIGAYLENNRVVVTGAAGSIGSELCRQICRFRPKQLILFERAESPLYDLHIELTKSFPSIDIQAELGDICDPRNIEGAFQRYRPKTVFHAAAYKHVPMLEMQPWLAISNNIIGSLNVVAAAKKWRTEHFVFVSTDKAVRPTNVMGASKRVSEMAVLCQNGDVDNSTKFMIVRFGNVVGSAGSVIPLFKRQIQQGGPVTVTHPDVIRYFMTIPEAGQLILQAGAMGNGGEIFILDMGTAININEMAHELIKLSGLEPNVDIKIEFTGLRPGEKLYEELITEGEGILPTRHEKILVLEGHACDLADLAQNVHRLEQLAIAQDGAGIRKALSRMLPEYTPAVITAGNAGKQPASCEVAAVHKAPHF